MILSKLNGLRKFIYNSETKSVQTMPHLYSFPPGQALNQYKGGSAALFNAKIREGIPLDLHEQALRRAIDRDLKALPDYNKSTFRSFDFVDQKSLNEFLEQHKAGKIVKYPAYTSSAKTPDAYYTPNGSGRQALIKINGKHGKSLSHIEKESNDEKEVLFGRNSSFKVRSIGYSPQMKTYFGEMDEI